MGGRGTRPRSPWRRAAVVAAAVGLGALGSARAAPEADPGCVAPEVQQALMDRFNEMLARADGTEPWVPPPGWCLSPEGAASLQGKVGDLERELEDLSAPPVPGTSPPPEMDREDLPKPDFAADLPPEGIFWKQEANDLPGDLSGRFENLWRRRIGDRFVWVYAGRSSRDAKEGALFIVERNLSTGRTDLGGFLTPIPGPVMIASAEGFVLTVVSLADGSRVLFDAERMRFLPEG